MILMPQIFNVIANENARYKRNELEYLFKVGMYITWKHKLYISFWPTSIQILIRDLNMQSLLYCKLTGA